MNEYTFKNIEELNEFLDYRKGDKEKHYYFGDIDCMDNELYAIEDIRNEMDPSWFSDGGVLTVYEFELRTFYAYLSERGDDSDFEVYDTAEEAVERARLFWGYLTDREKNSKTMPCHESAIVAWCYLESQIIQGYNTIWSDGEYEDISRLEKCASYNEQCRMTAEIIRKCQASERK